MLFTTRQKYISWKGTAQNEIVPTMSKYDPDNQVPNVRRANPIKHYRKQLNATSGSGTRGGSVGDMEKPGGSVYLNDLSCCQLSGPSTTIKTYVLERDTTDFWKNSGTYFTDVSNNVYNKCTNCDPESNVIKSATTLLSKKYYSDTKGYLQSRCRTYDQKLTIEKRDGISYNIPGTTTVKYPDNTDTGPQNFNTGNCPKGCQTNSSTVTTIYKPNNRPFAQEGAVSSGTRLAKLKYDTITRNGNSFRSAFGAQGANAGKYHGTSTAPYFVKNKNFPNCRAGSCNSQCAHPRTGNHTACFSTRTGDIVRQNKTTTLVYTR
jgi:hypothetical protein